MSPLRHAGKRLTPNQTPSATLTHRVMGLADEAASLNGQIRFIFRSARKEVEVGKMRHETLALVPGLTYCPDTLVVRIRSKGNLAGSKPKSLIWKTHLVG